MVNKQRFLILALTAAFIALFSFSSVWAQKETTPAAKPKVEYWLTYPGILPGHPLYPLKMLRDKIIDWFIKDPVKKAEYYLLMADKRLNAGLSLINQGKPKLAESTISKGEKYLEKAISELEKAKSAGKDIPPEVLSKFSLATLKHQEVLSEVLERVPQEAKGGIQNALEKSRQGIEKIQEIQGKKLEERLNERGKGTPPPPPPPVSR